MIDFSVILHGKNEDFHFKSVDSLVLYLKHDADMKPELPLVHFCVDSGMELRGHNATFAFVLEYLKIGGKS